MPSYQSIRPVLNTRIDQKALFPCYPGLGIAGTFVGLLAALLTLPRDYAELNTPYGLAVPSMLMMAGMLASPLLASLSKPSTWLRAEHVLLLGLAYWLLIEPTQGDPALLGISLKSVPRVFLMIAAFTIAMWIGATFAQGRSVNLRVAEPEPSPGFIYSAILICFGVGAMAYLVPCEFAPSCIVQTFFTSRFEAPWWHGALGGAHSFVSHLQYFCYLLPPLTVVLLILEKRMSARVIVATVLTTLFLLVLARDGGRRILGAVVGCAILLWLLLQPRLTMRHLGITAALAVVMLTLLQLMLAYRELGFSSFWQKDEIAKPTWSSRVVVDYNFKSLALLIENIPDNHPYLEEEPLVYHLVRPIPRYWWPEKPISPGVNMVELFGLRGVSLDTTITTSAIGDLYSMAGAWSVAAGGLLFGALAGLANRLLLAQATLRRRLVYALLIMPLFVGLRGLHELIVMSYPILALMFIFMLQSKRLNAATPGNRALSPSGP